MCAARIRRAEMRSALMSVMVSAARAAARGLQRDFGEVEALAGSIKGAVDFSSAAERRSEEVICAELERARPGYRILAEGRGEAGGTDSGHRWLIDPLDGTTNFLHGVPFFAISIALEQRGELIAGLVYDPLSDELFTAERGRGAYMNNRRLRVAARGGFGHALIASGKWRARRDAPAYMALMARTLGHGRRTGSSALNLAYVAAGRFDGFFDHVGRSWDLAAGIVLIREAGGLVSDLEGGQRMIEGGGIVAASPELHEPLRDLLSGAGAQA